MASALGVGANGSDLWELVGCERGTKVARLLFFSTGIKQLTALHAPLAYTGQRQSSSGSIDHPQASPMPTPSPSLTCYR